MKGVNPEQACMECRGCGPGARLSAASVAKLVADYVRNTDEPLASEEVVAERLASCRACADLLESSTCRYCGCFVQVRARLAGKDCPRPAGSLWHIDAGGQM